MGIETNSLILAANESREADFVGEYFELRSAVYDIALIELLDRSGGVRARLTGPLESDFVRPGLFEKLRITNGATAQTVKFAYGTGDAGSRRNSGNVTVQGIVGVSGTVDTVDGGKARTLAGSAFIGYASRAGGAGNYTHVQLWNKVASGKNLIVSQVLPTTSGGGANGVSLLIGGAQLTELDTAAKSKLMGGANSAAAEMRTQQNAAFVGTRVATIGKGQLLVLKEPIIVPPGFGLTLVNGVLAEDLFATFEMTEEAVA